MPLVKGDLSEVIKGFITDSNNVKQEDKDKAIENFCNSLEGAIYDAIKSITIEIPSGLIQVQGSPSAQVNINPIVLNDVVK